MGATREEAMGSLSRTAIFNRRDPLGVVEFKMLSWHPHILSSCRACEFTILRSTQTPQIPMGFSWPPTPPNTSIGPAAEVSKKKRAEPIESNALIWWSDAFILKRSWKSMSHHFSMAIFMYFLDTFLILKSLLSHNFFFRSLYFSSLFHWKIFTFFLLSYYFEISTFSWLYLSKSLLFTFLWQSLCTFLILS